MNREVNIIIAFSFGNRILDSGKIIPGPVNKMLGRLALEVHNKTSLPVYAQWEIASGISDKISQKMLNIINQEIDPDSGKTIYLNTEGVIRRIKKSLGEDISVNSIIIAHRDHAKRCIRLAKQYGFHIKSDNDITLPLLYDPRSGQKWTQNRTAYLNHELRFL